MINRNNDKTKQKEFRQVYADTLSELLANDEKVVILDADLAGSVNTGDLYKKYPKRAVNAGISEANMVGVAGGLSSVGYTPYIHTFAPFASRRVLDQVFMSLAYSKNSTHIYASDPGLYAQYNGGTHTTFEDVSVMRAIAGITVTAPSDPVCFEWVLRNYHENKGVYYTRAPRGKFNELYTHDSSFEYGKGIVTKEGNDVAIIALGSMVHDALEAAETLEKEGISVEVIDMFFVKPYDEQLLQDTIKKFDTIITVENHNKYGGISDIVSKEIVKSKKIVNFDMVAVNDRFGEIGNVEYLKDTYGLSAKHIVAKVKDVLNGNTI